MNPPALLAYICVLSTWVGGWALKEIFLYYKIPYIGTHRTATKRSVSTENVIPEFGERPNEQGSQCFNSFLSSTIFFLIGER
ncbi:hypothetical protein F4809DRAFT_611149 [Biscogniauxia mediterranea]|nr:hypothetical protein F4809DRAFT_611149 [Biscogniauxia mediterranea]